jgi:hypothetical protein
MATDATGVPTSPDSIPKYNTSVDAPSGLGFNAAMDAVQLGLTARILKSIGTTVGDLLYWSGVSTPARLGIGSAGQVLTVAGGIPAWATPVTVSNLISHTQITANVVSGAVSEATATTVITAPAFTPDGTSSYSFEVFTPDLSNGNIQAGIFVALHDGTNFIGQVITLYNGGTTTPSSFHGSMLGRYRYIPTATSKTYTARVWAFGGTTTFSAGAGGAGVNVPAYLRITKDV